jgi:hypothetical protein
MLNSVMAFAIRLIDEISIQTASMDKNVLGLTSNARSVDEIAINQAPRGFSFLPRHLRIPELLVRMRLFSPSSLFVVGNPQDARSHVGKVDVPCEPSHTPIRRTRLHSNLLELFTQQYGGRYAHSLAN